jgi:type IV pilus assembly protein PilW
MKSQAQSHPTAPRRARGFTLIEMMIAITLGLGLLAALTTFFVQTSSNRAEMDRGARQIESGRFAMDILREDLSLAGYYYDVNQSGVTWQSPAACTTAVASLGFSANPLQLPLPIFGHAGGAGAPGCIANAVPGTDVLVVRRVHSEPTPAASPVASQAYLQVSHCANDSSNTPIAFSEGGTPAPFVLRKVDCTTRGDLWRYHEHVYYIRACSVCGSDTIPTLVRLELDGGVTRTVELAEGIQEMRIDYGIDNDGNGSPDAWSRCDAASPCTAAQWSTVTAVTLNLLSSTLEPSPGYSDAKTYTLGLSGAVGPFNDRFKRHVYSAVVNLPNRSGPLERSP